jgi:ferritin-like metal-binding protein YciE
MTQMSNSLDMLFVDSLKDLYDAEHQILDALPKMEQKASSMDLKKSFQEHEQVTRKQAQRLEKIFNTLGEKPSRKKSVGMEGLIKEGEQEMKELRNDQAALDAALIGAAQKVEHYEIAGYGTVKTYARMLGMNQAADLLDQTLSEECAMDEKLTDIAEDQVNLRAENS